MGPYVVASPRHREFWNAETRIAVRRRSHPGVARRKENPTRTRTASPLTDRVWSSPSPALNKAVGREAGGKHWVVPRTLRPNQRDSDPEWAQRPLG
ncbi:hypothetical protein JOE21_002564 [Desmospora profundinema]|uniref:Uncharacterized protein n=1 Tax=Desmospora profundinema TaxID=1571184 RepID=A0ABU1IP42_9BACL|nr:hypothetical protein [Desmospora profundinema]